MSDHVNLMIAIPPKYAVSQVIGYIKGKSAIHLAGVRGAKAGFCGATLARGHYVSSVGRDEAVVRSHLRRQEKEDERLDQLKMGF